MVRFSIALMLARGSGACLAVSGEKGVQCMYYSTGIFVAHLPRITIGPCVFF